MENENKLGHFTPWAKEMYEMHSSRVCNTFIICGNIGDYAYGMFGLTEYLCKLFEAEDCFDFTSAIVYDPEREGVLAFSKQIDKFRDQQTSYSKPMTLDDICRAMDSSNNGKGDGKAAYIIHYPQNAIPNCAPSQMKDWQEKNCIRLHRALTSKNFFRSESIVVIIAESASDVNSMFTSSNIKSHTITIPLPNIEERKAFLQTSINLAQNRKKGFAMDVELDEFARLTAGLTRQGIEDLILPSSATNPIIKEDILRKKAQLIDQENSNIIELLDSSNLCLDDFAGSENIKSYFKEVVIDAISNNTTSIIPKGVLLMGPPGTGKSYFARCLAGSAGINFVEFKMSKILDKYLGVAEKNLEKAFAVFRALAPVCVFVDELDQALSRGDSSTGTGHVYQNIFGMFLSELSNPDNRGKIIWLGATNYPNRIDEALKRTGRFDKRIPFFAPDDQDRQSVLKRQIKKIGLPVAEDFDFGELAEKIQGFTQAEIEGIVVKATELAIRSKSKYICSSHFETALLYMRPAKNVKIEEMENVALLECNDLEFLSKKMIERREALLSS